MTPNDLNFRHLLYFWAVAKEGSITRAADRLGLSVQAISTQLSQLEKQLGHALFAPEGRSLKLTDSGRTALTYADVIFQTGERMREALADAGSARARFAVGITDAVPKLVAFRVLKEVLQPPFSLRLECCEGDFESLLGDLALNRLDMVIADRSAPERANLRFRSRLLGDVEIAFYARTDLYPAYVENFPHSLSGAPVLLPARSDPLRQAIDTWLAQHDLRPVVVGEFTDSALLKTFARAGLGLFAAPALMAADLLEQYGAHPLGVLPGVRESWYAIANVRLQHPAAAHILSHGLPPNQRPKL